MSRHAAAAAALLIVTTGSVCAAAEHNPIVWTSTVEVARGGGHQGPWQQNESRYDYVDDATVALARDGAAAVAWVDQARKDVFFQVYETSGRPRFRQPVNVSRSPRVFSWLPRVVLGAGRTRDVYIVWQEIVFSGGSHGGDIFFARSADGGAVFAKPVNLSRSTGGDGKGRINRDVWHNGSFDVVMDSEGTLHIAWTEYDGALWFSRSRNGGKAFTQPVQIGRGDAKPARAPALATASGGTIYLSFTVGEDDAADIRLVASSDRGRTWGESRIVARTSGYSDAPKIAVDAKGVLHLVHAESAAGPFDRSDIRYLRSRDGGRTFDAAREISNPRPQGSESAGFPSMSLDGDNNVYVLWELHATHREPPRGLALTVSRDGGDTFDAPAAVPGSADPRGGFNGSLQGRLMRKLAVDRSGAVAIVNSSFRSGAGSRVWLTRGMPASAARRR